MKRYNISNGKLIEHFDDKFILYKIAIKIINDVTIEITESLRNLEEKLEELQKEFSSLEEKYKDLYFRRCCGMVEGCDNYRQYDKD